MSKTPPFHPTHPHPPPVMCLSLFGPRSGGGRGIVKKHVYVLAAYRLYGILKKKKKLTFNLPCKDVQHLLAKVACHDEYPLPLLIILLGFLLLGGGGGWWSCKYNIHVYILVAEMGRKCQKKKNTSNLLYYSL